MKRVYKEYIVVIAPNRDERNGVDIIQFNNVGFLQGFISILEAYGKSTIDGKNGTGYTIMRRN